jgi:hypothetical protein
LWDGRSESGRKDYVYRAPFVLSLCYAVTWRRGQRDMPHERSLEGIDAPDPGSLRSTAAAVAWHSFPINVGPTVANERVPASWSLSTVFEVIFPSSSCSPEDRLVYPTQRQVLQDYVCGGACLEFVPSSHPTAHIASGPLPALRWRQRLRLCGANGLGGTVFGNKDYARGFDMGL